jgi:hypothetical protein
VHRKLHDETIVHQADEHPATGIAGRTSEHPADAETAVVLDEIGEKPVKIGSKRNRHAMQRL